MLGANDSIGDLFSRMVDQGGEVVRAEFALYRRLAIRRAMQARTAVVLLIGGVLVAFGAVSALLVMLAIALADYIGPLGGGVVIALLGLVTAGLMMRSGLRRFPPLTLPETDEAA